MYKPEQILKQHWGYGQFRPFQSEIINSVLDENDTLALLPTGGGKSICYQVPALCRTGVCIVITPLIALMRDQVDQLKRRDIPAAAIYSGMTRREIDITLDNCIYGHLRFLYVSPERLTTDIFKERLDKMAVSLIAVDEAHCISQWGYDFRPAYLGIGEFRKRLPDVPVIALTASATDNVQEDIISKLHLKDANKFSASFKRENINYRVVRSEDKDEDILGYVQRSEGTGIVYGGTRKSVESISRKLVKAGINADFYHAGLDSEVRMQKQIDWQEDKTRVLVSTTAFGMGIDKPNVRFVLHAYLPFSLEEFYQESGRAGRDGLSSESVMIYHPGDIDDLKNKYDQSNPGSDILKKVYQSLANYYQLAVGSGAFSTFDFDIIAFARQYGMNQNQVYYALKKLEEESLVQLSESFWHPSRLHILVDNQVLYKYQVSHPKFDEVIKGILRLYGGELFSQFTRISEKKIAAFIEKSQRTVGEQLRSLHKQKILFYIPMKDKPQLTFLTPRLEARDLPIDLGTIGKRKEAGNTKIDSVINYVINADTCRTRVLMGYFGESSDECGHCDICKNESGSGGLEIRAQIKTLLTSRRASSEEIIAGFEHDHKEEVVDTLRDMIDNGEIAMNQEGILRLR